MQDDAQPDAWAMSDAVTSRRDVGRKFGSITYSKGASVIRMMEGILTRDTMIKGLSKYLATWQYSNTVEEELFADFEDAGVADGQWPQEGVTSFEETMKTWTNQVKKGKYYFLQAGFPMVSVTRGEGGQVTFEQSW